MNSAQKAHLQGLARGAFAAQGGYRGGIDPQAQLDTAVRIAGKAIARKALTSRTLSPKEAVERAVSIVRTGNMRVAPSARTVAMCGCGKPKAPHTPDLHQPAPVVRKLCPWLLARDHDTTCTTCKP